MSQQGRRGSEQVRGSLVDLTSRNILPDEIFHLTKCDLGLKCAKNNDQNVHKTTIRWRHWVPAVVEEEKEVSGAKGFRGTWIQAAGESKVSQHHCHCLLTRQQQYYHPPPPHSPLHHHHHHHNHHHHFAPNQPAPG